MFHLIFRDYLSPGPDDRRTSIQFTFRFYGIVYMKPQILDINDFLKLYKDSRPGTQDSCFFPGAVPFFPPSVPCSIDSRTAFDAESSVSLGVPVFPALDVLRRNSS